MERQASDLWWVEECARTEAKFSKGHTIVVEKSTLPVKTAKAIKSILKNSNKSLNSSSPTFDVLSNPDFLAEWSAINDLQNPDRVLIGGENEEEIFALSNIYKNWIAESKILHTNIWSSELTKLTARGFLAKRISSINSIGALCEATGADVREVSWAIGSDSRIGSRFPDSGPEFGGSCFKKDILNLIYLSTFFGHPEVACFWESVVELNNWHRHRITQIVVKKLFGTLTGKKIAILGFSFKANTNDTRESASITICKDLLEEGVFLAINDPKVSLNQISKDLGSDPLDIPLSHDKEPMLASFTDEWYFEKDLYKSVENKDAILVLTEWE